MNTTRRKSIATMLLSLTLLLSVIFRFGIAYAEEYDTVSDGVDENVEAVAMATDSDPIINNGIPVLTLDIDPDEYQKVIDSPNHDYRAYTGTIRIDVPEGYTGEFSETELASLGTTHHMHCCEWCCQLPRTACV